jgi:hypothetical protein
MTIPNLAGVITKADIDTKGSGSYAASYVNWAKVAHLLHEQAPGWEFHLQPTEAGSLIWQAPDGTAYVVGYFSGPDDQLTAEFPFPAMGNRNEPIAFDKVSARTLSDTHRRALCAAAAFTFGLAYELWAKEEVENPHREEKAAPEPAKAQAACPMPTQEKAAAKPLPKKEAAVVFADQSDIAAIQQRILQHPKRPEVIEAFKTHKNLLPAAKRVADHIQTPADVAFLTELCNSLDE